MSVKYHILERLEECLESAESEILVRPQMRAVNRKKNSILYADKKMVTVSSVGLIGSHLAGLEQVSNQESLLAKFFEIFESSVGQIKGVFLQSLSKLISVR